MRPRLDLLARGWLRTGRLLEGEETEPLSPLLPLYIRVHDNEPGPGWTCRVASDADGKLGAVDRLVNHAAVIADYTVR